MDSQFRTMQKTYQKNTSDLENATKYIQALERLLAVNPPVNNKVSVSDATFPCLICEKQISDDGWISPNTPWITARLLSAGYTRSATGGRELVEVPTAVRSGPPFSMKNASRGVSCTTRGNYGSQVLDGEHAFFYICDDCLIVNSHKILCWDTNDAEQQALSNFSDDLRSTIGHVVVDPTQKDRLMESPWRTMIRHFGIEIAT